MYVKLESFWGKTIDPSEKDKCIINPALFQCYREEIPNIVEEFSNISNPTFLERLNHILRIYGPFTEARNDCLNFSLKCFSGGQTVFSLLVSRQWIDRSSQWKSILWYATSSKKSARLCLTFGQRVWKKFGVFLISSIRRFSQMWKHIYQPHNFYVIHIDLDSTHEFFTTVRALVHRQYNEHRNVEVLTNRY